jgi:preprotein translocase subunit Sec61beta
MSGIDPKTGESTGYYERTPSKARQNKIVKIFYDSSNMFPIKIIPTAILVVGVYFVYKKFIKK